MGRPRLLPPTPLPEIPEGAADLSRAEQAALAERCTEAEIVLRHVGLPTEFQHDAFHDMVKGYSGYAEHVGLALGALFLAIHAHEGTAGLRLAIDSSPLGERTVWNLMAAARGVAKSGGHRRIFDKLGQTKALSVFSHLTDEEIDEFADDDDRLLEFAGMTTRQVAAKLKDDLQKKTEKIEAQERMLRNKDEKNNELLEKLELRAPLSAEQERALALEKAIRDAGGRAVAALTEMNARLDEFDALRRSLDPEWISQLHLSIGCDLQLIAMKVDRLPEYGPIPAKR